MFNAKNRDALGREDIGISLPHGGEVYDLVAKTSVIASRKKTGECRHATVFSTARRSGIPGTGMLGLGTHGAA